MPSSSTFRLPRRFGIVPSSITVQSSLATFWPIRSAKAETPLAIEVAFEAVADRFVQQNSRPSRAEHDHHLARGRIDGVEVDDRLPRRLERVLAPALILEEVVPLDAAAAAVRSHLAALAVLRRSR